VECTRAPVLRFVVLELSRTLRFCLSRGAEQALCKPVHNSYSAYPAMHGLGRYYELTVTCQGEADPETGYFINIKTIDHAVRKHVLPYWQSLIDGPTPEAQLPLGEILARSIELIQPDLHQSVVNLNFTLSPRHQLMMETHSMEHVTLRQRYEFAAAHRLNVDSMTHAQNQQIFGKCNNPAGHGHNYVIEIAVLAGLDPDGHTLPVGLLDVVVDQHCIEHLDHKHLNVDVSAFEHLNPSVENIAKVVWDMLDQPIREMSVAQTTSLTEVRVYETEKTACVYHGPTPVSESAMQSLSAEAASSA